MRRRRRTSLGQAAAAGSSLAGPQRTAPRVADVRDERYDWVMTHDGAESPRPWYKAQG